MGQHLLRKKNRIAAREAAKKLQDSEHRRPALLGLFHKREQELGLTAASFPPYRKPEHTIGLKEQAAHAMAEWDSSNPFAYGRTYLHAKQGYIDPAEVVKEVTQRTVARRVAKVREVEAMQERLRHGA